jgi:hypothetical protein
MVYTQGLDFISDTTEVERLSRNVIVPADWTTDQVKSYQYKVYSLIRTITNKDDWANTDREYGVLQLIETELAAEMIKKHYGDINDGATVDQAISSLMAELNIVVNNMDTATTGATDTILETDYKSWNLNELIPPPNRLSNIGISEIDF